MSRDITTLRELAAEARKYHALDYMAPAISAAADRLAALEESNTLLSASLKKQDAQIGRLEQDNARLKQQADALAWLEHETCDLRCINVPTGGDDYEVYWQVIEHHMAEPQERVIGYGETPARAIRDAQRTLAAGGDA